MVQEPIQSNSVFLSRHSSAILYIFFLRVKTMLNIVCMQYLVFIRHALAHFHKFFHVRVIFKDFVLNFSDLNVILSDFC